jgi:hypothetical protein
MSYSRSIAETSFRAIEDFFRELYNVLSREGKLKKALPMFLELVLYLKQAISHPYTLVTLVEKKLPIEYIKRIQSELASLKLEKTPFGQKIGKLCERTLPDNEIEIYLDNATEEDTQDFGDGQYGLQPYSFDEPLEEAYERKTRPSYACMCCREDKVDLEPTQVNCHRGRP